ncbi:MAG: DsbA family protein [Rhodospirillaceae bacterium]|nr:DsbA family protein [Rhodospirillaceae bacterium]
MWHFRFFQILAVISLVLFPGVAAADSHDGFSDAQKKHLEKLIERYILDHPEVLLEAVQRHQARREADDKQRAKSALLTHKDQLLSDPSSPVGGSPMGDVTIVEFFDYRCGYCKRVHPTIKKIIAQDKGIRYVFKEFPILGPQSMTAARAALAVWQTAPEKYQAFHDAVMTMRGNDLNEAKIISVAEKFGIKSPALKKAMADKRIDEALGKNFRLAEALNINGTPAFIVGGQLVPGAVDFETLKKLVAEARGS